MVVFIFFFFKQKTAYEMCGRDWSSDVCSSDLFICLYAVLAPRCLAMMDSHRWVS